MAAKYNAAVAPLTISARDYYYHATRSRGARRIIEVAPFSYRARGEKVTRTFPQSHVKSVVAVLIPISKPVL